MLSSAAVVVAKDGGTFLTGVTAEEAWGLVAVVVEGFSLSSGEEEGEIGDGEEDGVDVSVISGGG